MFFEDTLCIECLFGCMILDCLSDVSLYFSGVLEHSLLMAELIKTSLTVNCLPLS